MRYGGSRRNGIVTHFGSGDFARIMYELRKKDFAGFKAAIDNPAAVIVEVFRDRWAGTEPGTYLHWGPNIDEIEITRKIKLADYETIVVAPFDTADLTVTDEIAPVLPKVSDRFIEGLQSMDIGKRTLPDNDSVHAPGATTRKRCPNTCENLDSSWERVAEHPRGALIAVRFAGTYRCEETFSRAMSEFLRAAIAEANAAGVIIDLTALDFGSGEDVAGLGALVMPLSKTGGEFRASAVVASERSARELRWLFEPNIILGVAGMKLCRDLDEALERVKSALD